MQSWQKSAKRNLGHSLNQILDPPLALFEHFCYSNVLIIMKQTISQLILRFNGWIFFVEVVVQAVA